jgi:hypothetical protein
MLVKPSQHASFTKTLSLPWHTPEDEKTCSESESEDDFQVQKMNHQSNSTRAFTEKVRVNLRPKTYCKQRKKKACYNYIKNPISHLVPGTPIHGSESRGKKKQRSFRDAASAETQFQIGKKQQRKCHKTNAKNTKNTHKKHNRTNKRTQTHAGSEAQN